MLIDFHVDFVYYCCFKFYIQIGKNCFHVNRTTIDVILSTTKTTETTTTTKIM